MIDKLVNKTILDVLYQCSGYPLAGNSLFTQVNLELDASAVSTSELREHLNHCRDKGWIDYQIDELGGSDKWYITERGRAVRA